MIIDEKLNWLGKGIFTANPGLPGSLKKFL